MLSPAKAHFLRKTAELASGIAAAAAGLPQIAEGSPAASEYAQLLMALGLDLRRLQEIQSVERKIEAKRTMIAAYLPWVEGALEAEQPVQDEIVATMLIWAIDLADWPLALRIAAHVLAHGLALPERYKRQPATLIAEEVAEAGLKNPPAVGYPELLAVAELTDDCDMHDQVRAKLLKALGLSLKAAADNFDPEAESAIAGGKPALIGGALAYFRAALDKDKSVGVKKLIEGLERELKAAAAPPA